MTELLAPPRQRPRTPRALVAVSLAPILIGQSSVVDAAIGVVVAGAMVAYLGRPEFIAIAGLLAIYSPVLFLFPGGPSLVNVYVVVYALRVVGGTARLHPRAPLVALVCLLLYATAILSQYVGTVAVVMVVLGIITLWGLLSELRDSDKSQAREQFLIVYVVSCLGASAYGLMHHRVITVADESGGSGLERYLGTQDDPNYMAMLLCIGLCFLLALPLRYRLLKLLMAVALVASIALTGSLTGLTCTMVVLALNVAFRSGKSAAVVLVVGTFAMGLVVAVVLYLGSLDLLPQALQARADEALLFVSARDYTQLTSGRSDIQAAYLDFFWAQGAAQVMFGGFGVSAFALAGAPFTLIGKAPHNSFIDILLTCGVVGASMFVILVIVSFQDVLRRYRRQADPVLLSILLGKVAWVMFATSISVFPSWTHLLLLFMP